jgi:predicted nucleotidyltransferase
MGAVEQNRILSMKAESVLSELKRRLQVIYGTRLNSLFLFGSHARGEAGSDSDIDVLVVLDGAVTPSKEIARCGEVSAQLSLQYDMVISCAFISTHRFATDRTPFVLNLRREALPV